MSQPTLALMTADGTCWATFPPGAAEPLPLPLMRFALALEAPFDSSGLERLARIPVDVVLLDLRNAREPRSVLILPVRKAAATAKVVVVGPIGDTLLAEQALRLGAAAYLSSDLSGMTLLRACNQVLRGEIPLSPTGQGAAAKVGRLGTVAAR
jgi:DNA-binding NarL/FixJ family response regulator